MKGIKTINPLRKNARTLRKEMTRQKRHLWYDFLKISRKRSTFKK